MWSKCLRSGGNIIIGGGLRTSFMSAHGIKIGGSKGSAGGALVGIAGGETSVTVPGQ